MEIVVERVAGLDVHKASVTACVRVPDDAGERAEEVQTFRTTVPSLLAMVRMHPGQGHLNAVANFEFERSIARLTGRDRT